VNADGSSGVFPFPRLSDCRWKVGVFNCLKCITLILYYAMIVILKVRVITMPKYLYYDDFCYFCCDSVGTDSAITAPNIVYLEAQ
jgi:hypothetical protein